MAETKEFPIADVLGVLTGRLLADIGGIYRVCGFMAGEDVYTHQLPRVSKEAGPAILALHPQLAAAATEAEQVTPENFREWLAIWTKRYGASLAVPKMSADQHESIDPLSELAERVHPDKIVVVQQ